MTELNECKHLKPINNDVPVVVARRDPVLLSEYSLNLFLMGNIVADYDDTGPYMFV